MARLKLPFKIFVEPQDEEAYAEYKAHIVVIEKNDQSLGYALTQIKSYVTKHTYDLVFKIDDDVKGIGTIEEDMDKVFKAFQLKSIHAICFPYKQEFYSFTKSMFSRINKRLQTCYIIRASAFAPSANIVCFEDFYQFLKIIQSRGQTLFCSRHSITCSAVGSGKGGLQDFDRSILANKSIAIFKRIDPTITVKHKPLKPWKVEPKFTGKQYKSFAIPSKK